ncbi:MAG TPA: sulfatase-like hydrolase/transferase [Planctomycetota bacterium]|nr:sulfatase-like hydrolase/transferase [Planctomycetota bacterium]
MPSTSKPDLPAIDRRVKLSLLALGFVPLALAAGIYWSRSGTPPTGPEAGFKNFLLVTFDTTRADHIGCYGNPRASTLNLDRMAREGVLFERCFSTAPITLPSHSSILTGMQPFRHGARNNGTHFVPEEALTMAEVLADEGFATGAVISSFVLDSRFGLDQGFDLYDDDLTNAEQAPMFMFRETKADDTSRRAREFIQARSNERWFLWVHYFDPHANYAPPEEFAELCPDAPYDGEIAYADAGLGEVLALLVQRGMLDETLVMVTSDHGEAFGDHGETTHGIFVYDSTTHVPWIARHPKLARSKRLREVTSAVDIFPTSLDLLGVDVPAGLDGRSLAREMLVPDARLEPSFAYSESMNPLYNHGWADLRTIRDERYRYVRAPREEFYDVMRDSRHENNLLEDGDHPAASDARAILEHLLSAGEVDVRGDDIKSMDPGTREALAALGYVWSSEGELSSEQKNLPDPKDRVHTWEKAQFANQLLRLGQVQEAESALRQVIEEDPGAILPRSALVGALMQQKKFQEAYEVQLISVSLPGVRTATWVRLGELERKLEMEGWEARIERAKIHDPEDPLPWIREADFAADEGDTQRADDLYRKALEIDERCAKAWIGIGNMHHELGGEEEAIDAFNKAIKADPVAIEAQYNLGVVYDALRRGAQAERAYLRALRIDPDHVLSLVNLGNVYQKAGKLEEAQKRYDQALSKNPEDYSAVFNLALCLHRQGEFERAGTLFGRASELRPDSFDASLMQIGALRKNGENAVALELAQKLIERNAESIPGLLHASALSHELGEPEVARDLFDRALALDPERVRKRAQRDETLSWALE